MSSSSPGYSHYHYYHWVALAPSYLNELLALCEPTSHLRPSGGAFLGLPKSKLRNKDDCASSISSHWPGETGEVSVSL